jgi:transcriptional regulator with GAF, ATPase, and Fis domain
VKVLITFTGFNDPYSKSLVQGDEQPGPILSLLVARKFDRVILLATPGTTSLTEETAAAISGTEVAIRSLQLPDPTDYLAILRELRRECGAIREQYLDAEFFVATASGTPQMHACWFLLTASGEVPATLLHVRPPRFVTKDLPVVSEIIASAGDFPKVLPHRLISAEGDPLALLDSALESVGLVVEHPAMRKLAESAAHLAPVATTVLLLGETGTGKEMFAKLIHTLSNRRGRFVALNCGAIPSELVESTLFGHLKGAFTGAVSNQTGKFEQAHEGTLLLDEIGELPSSAQVKLLRVLQDQMIEPVGSNGSRKVDVRVIAATNRNLLDEVKSKRFREDLYYRVCPITLTIPPLRERRSEITRIAMYLLDRLNRSYRRQRRFAPDTLRRLTTYSWPGNVRQLEGVISRAIILSANDLIEPQDLDLAEAESSSQLPQPFEGFEMDKFLSEAREILIDRALAMSSGNQSQAARLLGTSAQNISKFLKTRPNAG